jgi:hypothetical protein
MASSYESAELIRYVGRLEAAGEGVLALEFRAVDDDDQFVVVAVTARR